MLVCSRFVADLYEPPLGLDCFKDIKIPEEPLEKNLTRDVERSVLQEIYNETGGHNWTIQEGWNSTRIDHCDWKGVKCRERYVIGLTLNMNNLIGKIPSVLWKLRNLRVFCAPSNKLSGELKDFIFPNMTRLLRIDVSFSYLSGNLPDNIFSSLTSLQKVHLCCQKSPNRISGQIPRSISKLTNLQVLSLGENELYDRIPKDIGNLNKLWFLDLEFMPQLTGNIMIFLGMKSLKNMHLSNAGIRGRLPEGFGEYFPHLEELQLPQNPDINGVIPSSIGSMINLTKIIMHCNSLQGTVPKQIGNLPKLRILDLSNNYFEKIDSELTFEKSAQKLEKLSLGNNNDLSADIGKLIKALSFKGSELRVLNVSNCDFYGALTPAIWDLQNLIAIDLKHNRISGTIPGVRDDLMFLYSLDISHNSFEGQLPDSIKLLQSLMFLDIRGNHRMRAPDAEVNVTSGDIQSFMRVNPFSSYKNGTYTCPYARLTATNGSVFLNEHYYGNVFCDCEEGYYGILVQCSKCMDGGDCHSNPKVIHELNHNHIPQITMTIKRGYWPSPSPDNVTHLVKCHSLASENDWTCNPSGVCECWLNITSHTTVCNKSCICHAGSTNRLCSMCIEGYYKSGSLCVKCSTSILEDTMYLFVPVLLVMLLVMWGAVYFCSHKTKARFIVAFAELVFLIALRLTKIIAGWFLEISVVLLFFYVAGITQNTRGIMSILVFYIQVLDAIISANYIAFPEFVLSLQSYMSSLMNLDFTGISCEIPFLFTPLGNYILIFLFPIACLLLLWLMYGFRFLLSLCRRENDHNDDPLIELRCSYKKVSISCLCLTFFPVSKQTISILAPCKNDGTYSYMPIAPWIPCSGDDDMYSLLQGLGIIGVGLYVVGVPVVLQSLLMWYKWNKDEFTDENRKICDSWLGAIYLPYEENVHWYFEVFKLIRKLFIAVFLAVFPNTSSIQTLTVSFVLTICLIYQLKFEPYKAHGGLGGSWLCENFLEVVTLAVLNQSCVMLRFASYDTDDSLFIVWIVIAINIGVIVTFMVAILALLINICSRNENNQEERRSLLQNNRENPRS